MWASRGAKMWLANVYEWLARQYDHEARELLFAKHPRIGAVLTANPALVFIGFASLGLLLIGVAAGCKLLFLKCTVSSDGVALVGDVGYLATLNWSVMYCLVLPLIFAEAARLSVRLTRVLGRLSDPESGLITGVNGAADVPFFQFLKEDVNKKSGWHFNALCLLIATAIVVADVRRPLWGLITNQPSDTLKPDQLNDRWVLASRVKEWAAQVTVPENIGFNLLAYFFEGLIVYVSFFWVLRFWKALDSLGKGIAGGNNYRFDPWIEDYEDRLGLGSLGSVFTGFLRVLIIFLFYVAAHAIQVEAWKSGQFELDYVRSVISDYWAVAKSITDKNPNWNLIFGKSPGVGWQDPGIRILLTTMTIPIAVIIYVPLMQLKTYLDTRIDDERHSGRAEMRKLSRMGIPADDPRFKHLEERWLKLQKAQVWPCGNSVALRYFSYMSLLVLAAFLPRIGILVCTGIVISVVTRRLLPLLPSREKG